MFYMRLFDSPEAAYKWYVKNEDRIDNVVLTKGAEEFLIELC